MFNFEKYNPELKNSWDEFVGNSINGTFLLNRNYMDYHADRFEDNSIIVLNNKNQIAALLPANLNDKSLNSHGGLTYGGLIVNEKVSTSQTLEIFEGLTEYLKQNGFDKLIYKTVPAIYHQTPSQADIFALFKLGAKMHRRDVYSVINKHSKIQPPVQERRKRSYKKAQKENLEVRETDQLHKFHDLLSNVLEKRHNTAPVHTLPELQLLSSRFPNNIKTWGCFANSEMLSGVLLYITPMVVHAQYIASSDQGLNLGALDMLFFTLIEKFSNHTYFSFGISNENDGYYLNKGLIDQKEGFGARGIIHDHYTLEL